MIPETRAEIIERHIRELAELDRVEHILSAFPTGPLYEVVGNAITVHNASQADLDAICEQATPVSVRFSRNGSLVSLQAAISGDGPQPEDTDPSKDYGSVWTESIKPTGESSVRWLTRSGLMLIVPTGTDTTQVGISPSASKRVPVATNRQVGSGSGIGIGIAPSASKRVPWAGSVMYRDLFPVSRPTELNIF